MAVITQIVEGQTEVTIIPYVAVDDVRNAIAEELTMTLTTVDAYLEEEGIGVIEDFEYNSCSLKDFVGSLSY